jgi:hypothetical protein
MTDVIFNERVKYAATFFNNIGVASIAVGAVLPVLSAAPLQQATLVTVLVAIGCAAFGLFCFGAGQYTLGMLKG